MIKFLYIASVLVLLNIPSFSWNYIGHVLSAQIAYQQLTAPQKTYVDKASTFIYSHSSKKTKKLLNRYTNLGSSLWAAESILPDLWKRQGNNNTLGKSFKYFRASNQNMNFLKPIIQKNTKKMHYIDTVFPQTSTYVKILDPNNNIVIALQALHKSYASSLASNSPVRNVMMIYIIHLESDITQPLHTFTKKIGGGSSGSISDPTSGYYDLGGNKYCLSHLKYKKRSKRSKSKRSRSKQSRLKQPRLKRCRNNLHAKWDQNFGKLTSRYIKKHGGFHRVASDFIKKFQQNKNLAFHKIYKISYAPNFSPNFVSSLNNQVQYNRTLAYAVYNTPLYKHPSFEYIKQAHTIADYQLWLASMRILFFIQHSVLTY